MSNLDNVSIDAALNATHQIAGGYSLVPSTVFDCLIPTEETTKLHSQDDQFQERVKELAAVAAKAADLRDTVVALAQVGDIETPLIISLQAFASHSHRTYSLQATVPVAMAMPGR